MTLAQIIGGLCLLFSLALLIALARHCAWSRGYQAGWKEAEEWIVRLEADVDEARQQIWRESQRWL